MSVAEIRRIYGVPARLHARIECDGRPAEIVGFRDLRLRVRFDGDPKVYNAHPRRGTVYLDAEEAGS